MERIFAVRSAAGAGTKTQNRCAAGISFRPANNIVEQLPIVNAIHLPFALARWIVLLVRHGSAGLCGIVHVVCTVYMSNVSVLCNSQSRIADSVRFL